MEADGERGPKAKGIIGSAGSEGEQGVVCWLFGSVIGVWTNKPWIATPCELIVEVVFYATSRQQKQRSLTHAHQMRPNHDMHHTKSHFPSSILRVNGRYE